MHRKFTDVLNEYLALKEMGEIDHWAYQDGYTNTQYYGELAALEDELNSFFARAVVSDGN